MLFSSSRRHIQGTLQRIGMRFGFAQLTLCLIDEESSSLTLYASYGAEPAITPAFDERVLSTLRRGEMVQWRIANPAGDPSPYAILAHPLILSEQAIGILVARSYAGAEGHLTQQTSALSGLSDLLADILHQDLALELIQRRVEQLAVLNEITRLVSANIQIDELLETIYQQVGRVIDTSTYFVLLSDEESDSLSLEILYDEGVRFPKGIVSARQGLAGWVLQNRKPLRSNDLEVDLPRLDIAPNVGGKPDPSRSWLGVPMMRSDQVLGVLAVASYEKNAFGRDDEELLSNVATQAAIAIENARLYAEAHNRFGALQQAQEQMISMSRLATSAELAAGLGHEINNALTPILGVIQLALRRNDLSDDLQDDLGRVLTSAQRIRHIVKTFSEMATGRTLANQRRNLNTILLSALELFEWQFSSHHISVDLHLTESLPDIACDVLQLRQAVANVLLNALDAMPLGGRVTISSFLQDGKVCTRIVDTGGGIGQEDLDRVFDPWFTTKVEDGRARGLGLGLFVTYNVVKAHGGLVELTSDSGQGTSVLICLPIDQ